MTIINIRKTLYYILTTTFLCFPLKAVIHGQASEGENIKTPGKLSFVNLRNSNPNEKIKAEQDRKYAKSFYEDYKKELGIIEIEKEIKENSQLLTLKKDELSSCSEKIKNNTNNDNKNNAISDVFSLKIMNFIQKNLNSYLKKLPIWIIKVKI